MSQREFIRSPSLEDCRLITPYWWYYSIIMWGAFRTRHKAHVWENALEFGSCSGLSDTLVCVSHAFFMSSLLLWRKKGGEEVGQRRTQRRRR